MLANAGLFSLVSRAFFVGHIVKLVIAPDRAALAAGVTFALKFIAPGGAVLWFDQNAPNLAPFFIVDSLAIGAPVARGKRSGVSLIFCLSNLAAWAIAVGCPSIEFEAPGEFVVAV